MSNNIFSGKRFLLLFRQHFTHNSQLLLLSTIAYIGVIFIILSIAQIGQEFEPHSIDNFRGFMVAFVCVFGILYVGYSFPSFRSKERSINYLMIPSSVFEKFVFEFVSRIGFMLILLPLLYWVTFHLQGYFMALFTEHVFESIGFQQFTQMDDVEVEGIFWLSIMIGSMVLLGFVLAFTGAAMFSKQPLVKTMFAVAVIMMVYIGFTFIAIELLGVGNYNPTDSMWLMPKGDVGVFQFFGTALILANIVMLFVAYRKLKEREV